MRDDEVGAVASDEDRDGRSNRRTPWFALFGIMLVTFVAVGLLLADGGQTDDGRAAALALTVDELATAAGATSADYRRTSPPVDMGTAERAARTATLGKVPPPQSRFLAAYRHVRSGTEVTQAVIVYDQEAMAAELARAAAPLLGGTFGLMSQPVALDGADEALTWSSSRYAAITFRKGGVIALLGTTDTAATDDLERWAELLVEKASETATPSSPVHAETP